jgi:prevent-host-death family protein
MGKEGYSVAQARDNLAALLKKVEAGRHVHITRRGKPVAVLMSQSAFEALTSVRKRLADALNAFEKGGKAKDAVIDDQFLRGIRSRDPGREVPL